MHDHLEPLKLLSKILTQTARLPKLLDGARYCWNVQPSEYGAPTLQTTDTRNWNDVKANIT